MNEPVALHEAGHAVAAHALGRRIGVVTIEPGALCSGCCCYSSMPVKAKMPPVEAPVLTWAAQWQRALAVEVAVALAGGLSELLFTPRVSGRAPATVTDKVAGRLAGPAAAAPATAQERQRAVEAVNAPGKSDDEKVAELAWIAHLGDVHRAGLWLGWIEAETAVLLRQNERAVRRMAGLLMVRGTIGQQAAATALKGVRR